MKINTSRFGEVEIDENLAIHFTEGLLGFPEFKDYVIIEHNPDSPFSWLQSISNPDLAFVITNPFLINENYLEGLSPEEKTFFSNETDEEVLLLALVTIPHGKADQSTVNLMGPLVIETGSRLGRQVILANSTYSHRHPLLSI